MVIDDGKSGLFLQISVEVTSKTLKTIFSKLDTKKGAGLDGLPVIFIQKCEPGLLEPLKIIF